MERQIIETPVSKGRVQSFDKSGGPKKLRKLIAEAQKIANGQGRFDDKAEKIIGVAERISQTITPYTPCTKGCNHCCYMAVAVSEFEARMIGRFIGRDPAPGAGMDLHTYSHTMGRGSVERYTGTRCTLLGDDGRCTVYPVRPIACRTHHNMAVDEQNCVIVTDTSKPLPTTPAIDLTEFLIAHAKVFFDNQTPFADVREWFPTEGK